MHGEHSGIKIWLTLLLSLTFLAIGLTAVLASLGITFLPIPAFMLTQVVVEISLIVAGLLLFFDSFSVRTMMGAPKWGLILLSLLMAAIGAIPLLAKNKMLAFLPFLVNVSIPPFVLSILLSVYGLFLLFDFFQMRKAHIMGFT